MIQSEDFLRQSEILSYCLNGAKFSKADFAEMYNVTELTINRDLRVLRSNGIQINSRKGKVYLFEKPVKDLLIKYAAEYLPMKLNSELLHSQLKTFGKSVVNFYPYLILISKAVNERRFITIRYKRFYDNMILNYRLKPIRLVQSGYNWILQAIKENEKTAKSFYISRIENLIISNGKFNLISDADRTTKKYEIVLKFHPDVEDEVIDKIWFDEFDLSKDSKGFITLKTSQEITNKLAAWCISWWDMVEIVKPARLKNFIREMTMNFLKINK
ncbi:MAG: WYL domain-containing transcriptional regulator [Ignavibacteria bacterium]|nr:WYL domain-containing transcriptional regulator [Ignavibacteria bacterium]